MPVDATAPDRRYPVGRWAAPPRDPAVWGRLIDEIAVAPAQLRAAVAGLDAAQLDTPYREGGWTVRQVVHHVADSHMNAYIRFRKALTEDAPAITAYDEKRWAELADIRLDPEPSLALVEALHVRWTALLRALRPEDFDRTYLHPEMGPVPLSTALAMYAWHGRHHVAHIRGASGR
jgi:uncharacterized damage-inducible protein DinB